MPSRSEIAKDISVGKPVLFYDGECGLCNRVMRFLLKIDVRARLHFAPLQSPPAQDYLRSQNLPTTDFDSIVFVQDWNQPQAEPPRFRTDAALTALALVGGKWRFLARLLRVIPAPLRDAVYRLIARFRYRLFGPYHPTPLPNPEWAKRFLE